MLQSVFENFKNGVFTDIAGSEFKCKVPLSKAKVNELLASAIEDKPAIKRFEIIKISRSRITLHVTMGNVTILGKRMKIVDREILVRLHPELDAPHFELKMEILDGVGTIENEVLEVLFDTLFRNKTLDFERRFLLVRHSEFSDNKTYNNLLINLMSAKLITRKDHIEYILHFSFPINL